MGKRRADADSRRFFDEFESVKASYFRGRDIIDPAKSVAIIPIGGKDRLIATKHTWFAKGGGYSYFVCPRCGERASKLYLIDDAPRCVTCCGAMNIKHRSIYGFGRDERRRAQDQQLDQLIAKLEANEPLRHKPVPSSWIGAELVYNSRRLANTMRRRMIQLRLTQLASQQVKASGGLNLTRAYTPRSEVILAIPEAQQIWKARTQERLEQALDTAQCAMLKALHGNDEAQQAAAARIMLRTKQGRERGFR